MNRYLNHLKLVQLILLFILTSIIYFLAITQKLSLLINPRFIVLILISVLILLIFIAYLPWYMFGSHQIRKIKWGQYSLFVIMLIILAFPTSPQYQKHISRLKELTIHEKKAVAADENQAQDSSNAEEENQAGQVTLLKPEEKRPPDKEEFTGRELIFTDENWLRLLEELYTNTDQHMGKRVTVIGFIYRRENMQPSIFAIARMKMWCCAADAVLVGLFCNQGAMKAQFMENEWFEIQGTVNQESLDFGDKKKALPVIKVEQFRKIEPFENPYVYPNF